MDELQNSLSNNSQPKENKPEVRVYNAEVVDSSNSDGVYREKTTTIKEKEIVGNRPKSSLSQIILAFCAFITITFAVYDKVLKPYLKANKVHTTVVSASGNIEAKLSSVKNNGKFILLDCFVTNKDQTQENVTFFSNGKVVDENGKSANTVFVQPDGSNSFNISDTSEKQIDLPHGVPVRIRLMYDFQTKDESLAYASFVTSLGKIEFRDLEFK